MPRHAHNDPRTHQGRGCRWRCGGCRRGSPAKLADSHQVQVTSSSGEPSCGAPHTLHLTDILSPPPFDNASHGFAPKPKTHGNGCIVHTLFCELTNGLYIAER